MHIQTTFWTKEAFSYQELLLIKYEDRSSEPVELDRGSCLENGSMSAFFKRCEEYQKTKDARDSYRASYPRTQFGVVKDGKITPVVWFSIMTESSIYTHDLAFETTLICKNKLRLPFGEFFPKKVKTKYRYLKIKMTTYRYLSNQLKGK